jgi:hypothetical protein
VAAVNTSCVPVSVLCSELPLKSGRDEATRGSIPGSSPRPDREHRKRQPTTYYTVVCVKTAVEISEESRIVRLTHPKRKFTRDFLAETDTVFVMPHDTNRA